MNWKLIGIASALIAVIAVAWVAFSPSIPTAKAQYGTMILKVTDSETELTVDGAEVYVDDTYAGTTAQNGELDIHQLEYGRHRVSVLVPFYEHCKVDKYVDVNGNITVAASLNMPNPIFQVSVEVQTTLGFFNELGHVYATLSNTGEVVSQDTIVLIMIYLEEDISQPIASRIINFGNVAAGALPIRRGVTDINEFVWLKAERVAAIVIDRCKFTPENNHPIAQSTVPLGFGSVVLEDAYEYIKQHPEVIEVIGTIAQIVLA